MPKRLTPSDLPEDVARLAKAHLAAGRFASVEEFLSACGAALVQRDAAARYPFVEDEATFIASVREGLTDVARGDLVPHEKVVAETKRLIEAVEAQHPPRLGRP